MKGDGWRAGTVPLVVLALLVCGSAGPAGGVDPGIAAVRVASGLTQPIFLTSPPGDPRLFVVEQRGLVLIIEDGAVLPTPFLDVRALTHSTGERGLLGLAFPPDHATSGLFYINYTASTAAGEEHPDGDVDPGDTVIDRFEVSGDPEVASFASRERILTFDQPFGNHNAGTLNFGPDGLLWIATGDGGSGGDPDERAQNGGTLLGKMLRIDVSGPTDPPRNYGIPDDNPFVGAGDPIDEVLDEIWALGFRNPFRWSFDRQTGDLYIGDVGQNAWEEVSIEPAGDGGGRNYGWDCKEGTHDFEFTVECAGKTLTPPVHEYPHVGDMCSGSVTGGYVYRGEAMPELRGTYFFADFCQQRIWSFVWDGAGGIEDLRERTAELTPPGSGSVDSVAGFGQDASGELYLADRDGEIFKIVPAELQIFVGDG